jgi:hypothetical protein
MGAGSSVLHECVDINGIDVPVNGILYKVREKLDYDSDSDYESRDESGFLTKCTCVFCARYENLIPYEVDIAMPCYKCVENLRLQKYNKKYAKKMFDEITYNGFAELIGKKCGWMTEQEGIDYATKKGVDLSEFSGPRYLLKSKGILLCNKK